MATEHKANRKYAGEIRITVTVPADWTATEDKELEARLEHIRKALTSTARLEAPERCRVEAVVV